MISTSLQPAVDTTVGKAESIATSLRRENPAIDQAVQDFEAVFVSLLLKEMRNTGDGGGLFGGDASDSYGGLFDLYMSQHIAKSGGLGIAEMLGSQVYSTGISGSQVK